MFRKEFHISELIARYVQGELSASEEVELNIWLNSSSANRKFFERFQDEDILKSSLKEYYSIDREELLELVRIKIFNSNPRKRSFSVVRLWVKGRENMIAASIILFLSAALYLYNHNPDFIKNKSAYTNQDVRPGKHEAMLTLANGKTVVLNEAANGVVFNEAGVTISKSKDGQIAYKVKSDDTSSNNKFNTLSTAKGQTYRVQLPDGSLVWLNAASSLTYTPSLLKNGRRIIRLVGEAYFEVWKDRIHPFIVRTDKQEIEVLGTHFNVNSYRDEATINTVLVEGSVMINKNTILKPGEQANFYRTGNIIVSKADLNKIAWKEGKFRFNNTSLEDVLRQLARWYDVDFIYEGKISDKKISGGIDRNTNISVALEILAYMNIHFKINGRKIIITD